MAPHERGSFPETPEATPASFTCLRWRDDDQVRWVPRTKMDRIPHGADERDRAPDGTLRNSLIRVDGVLVCRRCACRLGIASRQSIVFV